MHRDGVGDLQLVQVFCRVKQAAVIHPHHHGAVAHVDGFHNADITVIGSHALLPANAVPDDLVVVPHLHHLIAHPEHPGGALELGLALLLRVEQVLQLHIQRLGAGGSQLGGAEHLNIPDRVKAITPGQTGGDKIAHQFLRRIAVRFQKEEIVCLTALLQRLTADDVVGVLHNKAAFGLPEDLVQADGGHQPGADDLAQNVAGPHAGQLVGIAHHNNAAAVPQGCNERLKQLHIHHTHLIQNDHIAFEQVLVIVDKADHAAGVVHLQQAVDGRGLAAGQFTQPFGRTARGGTKRHPVGLMFQQLQDGVDRSGLTGAGAAGQHKAVFGHGLADGFPLQGRIGKALGQLQHLNVFIKVPHRLLFPLRQQGQPVGNGLFCFQQVRQIDIRHRLQHLYAKLPGLNAVVQRTGQLFGRLLDEVGCRVQQLRTGQAGVAVARVVAQGAQKRCFQPLGAVPFHVVILCNAVRMTEIQLQGFPTEQIRVLGDGLHGTGAKDAEHLHGAAGADLELRQIGDQLPHSEHPLELLLDAVGLVCRDAGDQGELGGVVGDHLQRRRAEFIDDLIGRARPNIRQGAAGKEGVYRFQILRHIGLALLGVELAAIGSVVLIFTAADHALARMELAHDPAHHGDRAAAGNFKHRVAVIRVLVDNVLHRSLDLFQLHAPHPLVT